MTTQPKTDLPTHFDIKSALKPSTVLCEQINSVYIERIGEWIGTLTPDEMKDLDDCIAISAGINNVIDASSGVLADKFEELEKTKKEAAEAREAQAAAEKKATAYKEMYDFLLAKRMEQ
jgi:mRNA interferase MazF